MYMLKVIVSAVLATAPVISASNMVTPRDLGDLVSGLFGNVQLGSLGSVSCNVARLDIVKSLSDTKSAVKDISDATVKQGAEAGIDEANSGISTIAQALFSGQAPPSAGRDTVATGLAAAATALMGANQNDTAVVKASAKLADSMKAGQEVVAKC